MKIVQICYKYPPNYSGYGKQLKTINSKIKDSYDDIKITILTSKTKKEVESYEANEKPIQLGSILLHRFSYSLGFYFYSICTFIWLLFNKNKYQIIHCIKAGPEAALAVIIGRIYNKPVVVKIAQDEMSENEVIRNRSYIKKKIRIWRNNLIKKADGFIAISKAIEKRLLLNGISQEKIYNIPNGVDTNKFNIVSDKEKMEIRKKINLNQEDLIFLFSGSISIRKGVFDLLEAIKDLKVTSESKVCILFCGPIYDEEEKFIKSLKELNNSFDNVKLRYDGEVNNINQYMQAADIVVLPSYSEGLPNVLLEASFSGCAILASDIDGNSDIVKHEFNGLLFKLGDNKNLTHCIELLVLNQTKVKEYAKNNFEKANQNYDGTHIAISYMELYELLLTNRWINVD